MSNQRELISRKQLKALRLCAGAWQDEDHPELPDTVEGLGVYLRRLRVEGERGDTE